MAVAAVSLASCTVVRDRGPAGSIARVNPASIAASPAEWDGREVEMIGLLVWESGSAGLYQSYGAYCRVAERGAISVPWGVWPRVTPADSRRMVVVRGTFRNALGVTLPAGVVGPGPLQPGAVVRWLSPPRKPCPAAARP